MERFPDISRNVDPALDAAYRRAEEEEKQEKQTEAAERERQAAAASRQTERDRDWLESERARQAVEDHLGGTAASSMVNVPSMSWKEQHELGLTR